MPVERAGYGVEAEQRSDATVDAVQGDHAALCFAGCAPGGGLGRQATGAVGLHQHRGSHQTDAAGACSRQRRSAAGERAELAGERQRHAVHAGVQSRPPGAGAPGSMSRTYSRRPWHNIARPPNATCAVSWATSWSMGSHDGTLAPCVSRPPSAAESAKSRLCGWLTRSRRSMVQPQLGAVSAFLLKSPWQRRGGMHTAKAARHMHQMHTVGTCTIGGAPG